MDTATPAEETKLSKYFAFISYSSADVKWGIRLQKQLEQYRLPARLRKKYPGTPKRAFPIFRDDTDLAGFKVWASLERELEASRYLIVLCSPRSAASTWVNDEIQYFIDHGREERILPLIIDGIPNSGDPNTECFPPALRNMTDPPLGVSVAKLGWRKAYLRMISTLLHIDYDELLLRDKRRRIRNGILRTVAGILLASGLTGLVWYNMEHSKFYNAYTLREEVPVGLYELTDQQRAVTNECYRITTRRGKVVRLETVNANGVAMAPYWNTAFTDYPMLEYQYDDEGQLITVIQKDATGMEITRKVLTANPDTNEIAIDFRSPSNSLNAQSLSADMSASAIGQVGQDLRSEITRQRNTYDEAGRLLRSLYQRDNLGTPACDSNGVYGKAYEYNEEGLVKRVWNLDASGQPFNCKHGWAYEEYTYDQLGNPLTSGYFDTEGNPAWCADGYSSVKVTYDEKGNITRWEALDTNGQLTCAAKGFAVRNMTYSEAGFTLSEAYFDAEGNPVFSTEGFHEIRCDYDEKGRICCYRLYDTEGNPVYASKLCYAVKELTLDEDGRILEQRFLDTRGEAAFGTETGACGFRYTYDENGYIEESTALNENWEPTMSKYGNVTVYSQRDGDGRLLLEECRDERGNLMRNSFNIAVATVQYDAFGNQTKISYFDENRQPCCSADGYASIEYAYENGNLVSETYFDPEGMPTLSTGYYHQCRMEYDETGNCLRWSYYDTEGNPVNLKEGYASLEQRYDVYGNVVAQYCFGADGAPACHRDTGACGMRWTYSPEGHAGSVSYLDAEGNPTVSKYGYATEKRTLDAVGRTLRSEYCDAQGNPIRCSNNYAAIEYTYDNVGNPTGIRVYDENGNPCYHADGYSTLERVYEKGNLISEKYFDVQGNPMVSGDYFHEFRKEYDEKGNSLRWTYYDTEGQPLDALDGYAAVEQTYDIYGNVTGQTFYTAGGEVAHLLEIYRYDWEYDNRGNMIREVRHTRFPNNLYFVIVEAEYDVLGNQVAIHYFDENGVPPTGDKFPYLEKDEYDRHGNRIRSEYLFEGNSATICEHTYDDFGNMLLESWSRRDASGETVCIQQTRMTYDAYGNCVHTEYLDGQGNPAVQEGGYASFNQGFSPTGEVIWQEYFGPEGEPALYYGETFRYEYDYDARGCWTELRKYDTEGNLHKEESGLSAIDRYEYDARGIRIYEGWFNEKGEPFGTEEDPRSCIYYTIDPAGFIDKSVYYDRFGNLLREEIFYAYAGEVYEGKSAYDAGVEAGQFIIQLGNWNCFDDHPFSASASLRSEVSRTVYTEKVLIMCQWTEDDTFIFRRYEMPEGEMGIRVRAETGESSVIARMEEAYRQWLRENP